MGQKSKRGKSGSERVIAYWYGYDIKCLDSGRDVQRSVVKRVGDEYGEWMQGQVLLCKLDCDRNTLTFIKNSLFVACIDIEPHQTYYPVLDFHCYKGNEYQSV